MDVEIPRPLWMIPLESMRDLDLSLGFAGCCCFLGWRGRGRGRLITFRVSFFALVFVVKVVARVPLERVVMDSFLEDMVVET